MTSTPKTWLSSTIEGIELYKHAKIRESERSFTEAVRLARDNQATPVELCETLNNLSIAYFALSRFTDAESILREARKYCQGDSDEEKKLRICYLNNQARLHLEMEQTDATESALLEAIELAKQFHFSYAAELYSNLSRLYFFVPTMKQKGEAIVREFERLHGQGEEIEVYFDLIGLWRRPGRGWDRVGKALSAATISARVKALRAAELTDQPSKAKPILEALLKQANETDSVPAFTVLTTHLALAEISFTSGAYLDASKHAVAARQAMNHPDFHANPILHFWIAKSAVHAVVNDGIEKCLQVVNNGLTAIKQTFGERNPFVGAYLAMKAGLLGIMPLPGEDTDEALALQALDVYQDFYLDTSGRILGLQMFLATIYMRQNRLDEAERLLTKTLEDSRNHFDSNNLELSCIRALSNLRFKQHRPEEGIQYVRQQEELLDCATNGSYEAKLGPLWMIAHELQTQSLFTEAERILRKALSLVEPEDTGLAQRCRSKLADFLLLTGRTDEASVLLQPTSTRQNNRERLRSQAQVAWSLQTKNRLAESKAMANTVLREAREDMPECEESMLIAATILLEQAQNEKRPDEVNRLVGLISEYKDSIRIRSVMPKLYLTAAQSYAQAKSIKAAGMFEQAMEEGEKVSSVVPYVFDECCDGYLNYLLGANQTQKAVVIADRLLAFRGETAGKRSQQYAIALNSKAVALIDTNLQQANDVNLEALKIMDALPCPGAIQLGLILAIRINILKKMLRFDEAKIIEERLEQVKTAALSEFAALQAPSKGTGESPPAKDQ